MILISIMISILELQIVLEGKLLALYLPKGEESAYTRFCDQRKF
jgi:hypothetical protein